MWNRDRESKKEGWTNVQSCLPFFGSSAVWPAGRTLPSLQLVRMHVLYDTE